MIYSITEFEGHEIVVEYNDKWTISLVKNETNLYELIIPTNYSDSQLDIEDCINFNNHIEQIKKIIIKV